MTDMKDEGCLGYIGGLHASRVGVSILGIYRLYRYPKTTAYLRSQSFTYSKAHHSWYLFVQFCGCTNPNMMDMNGRRIFGRKASPKTLKTVKKSEFETICYTKAL